MTVAPRILANWITYWLTDPAPPETSKVMLLSASASANTWWAVIAGMPRQAPASKLTLSGSFTAWIAGSTMYSAAVPNGALPLPVPDPDPLAYARLGHAVAHLVDDARAVALRHHARKGDLAHRALARFDVGGVDAGGRELDANLAGPACGVSISPTRKTSRAAPFFS